MLNRTGLCSAVALLFFVGTLQAAEPANQLSQKKKTAGWKLLFDGTSTNGWHSYKKHTFPAKGWEIKDGWLHCLGQKGGDLLSEAEFEQFDLEWDWKLAPVGNSGVKYFVLETRPSVIGHEYQMIDDEHEPDAARADGKHLTATFYDVLKTAVKTPLKPCGEINHSRILVKGNHVEHWLNGVKVLEYECGSDEVKKAVAESKFKNVPGFGERVKAHILLQDHNCQVWFQNIKIRDLGGK
jgi:hypothetical protein